MTDTGPIVSRHGLSQHEIQTSGICYWNLPPATLYEHTIRRGQGSLASGGALVVMTGVYTGRSPKDKFIVRDSGTEDKIWWGDVNVGIGSVGFEKLHAKVLNHFKQRDLYVQDLCAGTDTNYRMNIRVVSESPWHSLFAHNMFLEPAPHERKAFNPQFTILHAPELHADPEKDGTNSECFVVVNFERSIVLVGGTIYAGEIKKSIFSILNYLLPDQGVLPMHCSANVGPNGDTAIFFGLSGTGKTTLSADSSRTLIGDDEHGWSGNGVFNFEGGCYAKVIRLSPEAEPEIYSTTSRFGTILENVVMDPDTGLLDLDDAQHTENTRASYPIDFIPNASPTGIANHPNNIIMLTADAFGVLPPISHLSPEQAMYHFLSGYTARVAGTEKGLKEPAATFSTCFGAPFMPRHPSVYANLLGQKMSANHTNCWLVNTGWSGGPYGTGNRMEIGYTRAIVSAALNGQLANTPMHRHPTFGLMVPQSCPGVPNEILDARKTWTNPVAYDEAATSLVSRFSQNFEQFAPGVDASITAAAIGAQ
tara:strand:- start:1276 stop:2880 length:1605 start_codon:yes stop_codon:yes gene_type:complete